MDRRDNAADLADAILKFRRARSRVLPAGIFAEPAWDLLLELFVADAAGTRLTARGTAERVGVSLKIMSRWLQYLSHEGLVNGEGAGKIDDPLTLSPDAISKMEQLLRVGTLLREHSNPAKS